MTLTRDWPDISGSVHPLCGALPSQRLSAWVLWVWHSWVRLKFVTSCQIERMSSNGFRKNNLSPSVREETPPSVMNPPTLSRSTSSQHGQRRALVVMKACRGGQDDICQHSNIFCNQPLFVVLATFSAGSKYRSDSESDEIVETKKPLKHRREITERERTVASIRILKSFRDVTFVWLQTLFWIKRNKFYPREYRCDHQATKWTSPLIIPYHVIRTSWTLRLVNPKRVHPINGQPTYLDNKWGPKPCSLVQNMCSLAVVMCTG